MNSAMDRDARTRARMEQHWEASESGDSDTEHAIYAADAILDYPAVRASASGAGRRSRRSAAGTRPSATSRSCRIQGAGDLWVSECVITYDGVPTYSVSIMEISRRFLVTHETQYFADPFPAAASPAALAR